MIGKELAHDARGWRRWLYRILGTVDVDERIWYWQYRRLFLPHLSTMDSARILDAGCAKGLWSFYLARKFPNHQVVGIDARHEAISFCQNVKRASSLENTCFRAQSFGDLTFRNEFDVVLSFNSLHYSYRNDTDILRRFADALRPGGTLMLTVPVALALTKRRPEPASTPQSRAVKYGIAVNMQEFLDHYYPQELSNKLSSAGFETVEMWRVVGRQGQLAKRIYARFGAHGFYKLIVWPFAFGLGWFDSKTTPNRNGSFLLVLARTRE